jgi:hypothetical protein
VSAESPIGVGIEPGTSEPKGSERRRDSATRPYLHNRFLEPLSVIAMRCTRLGTLSHTAGQPSSNARRTKTGSAPVVLSQRRRPRRTSPPLLLGPQHCKCGVSGNIEPKHCVKTTAPPLNRRTSASCSELKALGHEAHVRQTTGLVRNFGTRRSVLRDE